MNGVGVKIIFLDMDGVVNSADFLNKSFHEQNKRTRKYANIEEDQMFDMIDPTTVPHLNFIIAQTGAKIVLSSSWRIPWHFTLVEKILKDRGFVGELIDATPNSVRLPEGVYEYARGHEIQAWLDEHPEVATFVILDDCDDMAHLVPKLVLTSWNAEGLTAEHAAKAVEMLKGEI